MEWKNPNVFLRWIIKNDDWKYLFVEKNDTRRVAPWKALLPWWCLEFWEDVEDCLIREIKEEIDLDVESLELIGTQKIILDWVHWLWIYYICKTKDLNFKNNEPEKHTRVFWWDFDNIDEYWKAVLKKIWK